MPKSAKLEEGVDLLIASFGALFFELLLIRWLPTDIYYLGYFKNAILIATFAGFGVGAATRFDLARKLSGFGAVLLLLFGGVSVIGSQISVAPSVSSEFLWPRVQGSGFVLPLTVFLVVSFTVAALLTIPFGNWVGQALGRLPPLLAYAVNLVGSLLGLGTFLMLGFLEAGPPVWFALSMAPVLFFLRRRPPAFALNVLFGSVVVGLAIVTGPDGVEWSPYSKIELRPYIEPVNARLLTTNGNGHQVLYDFRPEMLARVESLPPRGQSLVRTHYAQYESPYAVTRPRSVLIIGAGTGNEAAAALRNGVERIDVVEIDPVILRIGREQHPEDPYHDPRVTIINDDARHYMATTDRRYDLILFGFLDSTSHLSSFANIRLDNYVYTIESFRAARRLLTERGVMQVSYYALVDFVRLRLFLLMREAFGEPPLVYELAELPIANVYYFGGPGLNGRDAIDIPGFRQLVTDRTFPDDFVARFLSSDDWPYMHLRGRAIGGDYLVGLAAMMLVTLALVRLFVWRDDARRRRGPAPVLFFLQGVAFMLLETNTITRMALVLGSTWVVTSLAVAMVLVAALVATFVVNRFARPGVRGILLFVATGLVLNYSTGLHAYETLPRAATVALSALQVYWPILGTSLLFCRLFQHSEKCSFDFGINILGAVAGGVLEYASLLIGVSSIYLLVLAVVLLIFLLHERDVVAEKERCDVGPLSCGLPGSV